MAATTKEGRTGRRAECRGVELVVAKPGIRQALHRRHVDGTAECTRLAEPHVVDKNDEDIGRFGRCLDLEALSTLQPRAMSNFGTVSATAMTNCEARIMIETETNILSS